MKRFIIIIALFLNQSALASGACHYYSFKTQCLLQIAIGMEIIQRRYADISYDSSENIDMMTKITEKILFLFNSSLF